MDHGQNCYWARVDLMTMSFSISSFHVRILYSLTGTCLKLSVNKRVSSYILSVGYRQFPFHFPLTSNWAVVAMVFPSLEKHWLTSNQNRVLEMSSCLVQLQKVPMKETVTLKICPWVCPRGVNTFMINCILSIISSGVWCNLSSRTIWMSYHSQSVP